MLDRGEAWKNLGSMHLFSSADKEILELLFSVRLNAR